MQRQPARYKPVPVSQGPSAQAMKVERLGWLNCTNVILFGIFIMLLVFGVVALVEGVKTKPTAMEMMTRFVGISDFVRKSDRMLDSDGIKHMIEEALRLYRMVPQDTLQELIHKSSLVIHSVSEEDLVQLKSNIVKFADTLGSIEKEKIQRILDEIDVSKINALVENTAAIETRLKDLHEIKIQI